MKSFEINFEIKVETRSQSHKLKIFQYFEFLSAPFTLEIETLWDVLHFTNALFNMFPALS